MKWTHIKRILKVYYSILVQYELSVNHNHIIFALFSYSALYYSITDGGVTDDAEIRKYDIYMREWERERERGISVSRIRYI